MWNINKYIVLYHINNTIYSYNINLYEHSFHAEDTVNYQEIIVIHSTCSAHTLSINHTRGKYSLELTFRDFANGKLAEVLICSLVDFH